MAEEDESVSVLLEGESVCCELRGFASSAVFCLEEDCSAEEESTAWKRCGYFS